MDDELRAEVEFIRIREAELKQELQKAEEAYGEPVTAANADRIVSEVLEALSRLGNSPLAEKYLSRINRWRAAVIVVNRNNSARVVD